MERFWLPPKGGLLAAAGGRRPAAGGPPGPEPAGSCWLGLLGLSGSSGGSAPPAWRVGLALAFSKPKCRSAGRRFLLLLCAVPPLLFPCFGVVAARTG